MPKTCQHCGTSYSESTGVNGFCCGGCEQVYHLIQEQGLDDFYQVQDRSIQPIGSKPLAGRNTEWAAALQASAEDSDATPTAELSLSGMSCAGCVWLVERLGRRASGLVSIKVILDQQSVVVTWERGEFSLEELVQAWQRFGYVAAVGPPSAAVRLSPMAWRTLLCALFAGNAWMLAAFEKYNLGGEAYAGIVRLFALLCALLSLTIGASLFVFPVYQRLRMRHWHYDLLPSVAIVLWFVAALLQSALGAQSVRPYLLFSLGVWILVCARWSQRWLWSHVVLEAEALESRVWSWLRNYTWVLLALGLLCGVFVSWEAMLASLLASSLYPMAMSVGYRPSAAMITTGFLVSFAGVLLAYCEVLSVLGATLWMGISGILWTLLFACAKGCFLKKGSAHA